MSSLTLWPDCGILQDPLVELVFVDYHGFLGLPPDQLETPLSLPKNAPDNTLNFNFGQGNVDAVVYVVSKFEGLYFFSLFPFFSKERKFK